MTHTSFPYTTAPSDLRDSTISSPASRGDAPISCQRVVRPDRLATQLLPSFPPVISSPASQPPTHVNGVQRIRCFPSFASLSSWPTLQRRRPVATSTLVCSHAHTLRRIL